MNRRGFLTNATVALAAGMVTTGCRSDAAYELQRIAKPLLLVAMGAAKVRDIGQRYMASTPAERDEGALVAAIEQSARQMVSLPWTPLPPLESLIADDFASGRTVLPGGWILSETEARQCALFALGESHAR